MAQYGSQMQMNFPNLDAVRERMSSYVPNMTLTPLVAQRSQMAAANKVLDTMGVTDEKDRGVIRAELCALVIFDVVRSHASPT